MSDWGKEADPRKYYFGHSLYRRIVSMATALELYLEDKGNVKGVEVVKDTMGLINEAIVGEESLVEVYKYRIGEDVVLSVPGTPLETVAVICGRATIMENNKMQQAYMTDMTDVQWILPDFIEKAPPMEITDD